MARKTKEEAQETRESILCAALDVFCEKGYSKSTCEDVAQRIGLSKGAVYWHFKSKQELLIELMNSVFLEEERLLHDIMKGTVHFQNLTEYMVSRALLMTRNEKFRKFHFFVSFQMEWTEERLLMTKEKIVIMKSNLHEMIHNVLKDAHKRNLIGKDINLRQIEDILISLYYGLVKGDLGGLSSTDLATNIETGFRMIINGIKA